MITLKDFLECVGYRITEGSDYCWDSFGPDAYRLESWDESTTKNSVSVVFDKKTQTVYQIEAWDHENQRTYRWTNPAQLAGYQEECVRRNISFSTSVDNEQYIDIEVDDDILEKARAISAGLEYDCRIQVELNFTDEETFSMMKMAHSMDMSFNEFVGHVLTLAIKEKTST